METQKHRSGIFYKLKSKRNSEAECQIPKDFHTRSMSSDIEQPPWGTKSLPMAYKDKTRYSTMMPSSTSSSSLKEAKSKSLGPKQWLRTHLWPKSRTSKLNLEDVSKGVPSPYGEEVSKSPAGVYRLRESSIRDSLSPRPLSLAVPEAADDKMAVVYRSSEELNSSRGADDSTSPLWLNRINSRMARGGERSTANDSLLSECVSHLKEFDSRFRWSAALPPPSVSQDPESGETTSVGANTSIMSGTSSDVSSVQKQTSFANSDKEDSAALKYRINSRKISVRSQSSENLSHASTSSANLKDKTNSSLSTAMKPFHSRYKRIERRDTADSGFGSKDDTHDPTKDKDFNQAGDVRLEDDGAVCWQPVHACVVQCEPDTDNSVLVTHADTESYLPTADCELSSFRPDYNKDCLSSLDSTYSSEYSQTSLSVNLRSDMSPYTSVNFHAEQTANLISSPKNGAEEKQEASLIVYDSNVPDICIEPCSPTMPSECLQTSLVYAVPLHTTHASSLATESSQHAIVHPHGLLSSREIEAGVATILVDDAEHMRNNAADSEKYQSSSNIHNLSPALNITITSSMRPNQLSINEHFKSAACSPGSVSPPPLPAQPPPDTAPEVGASPLSKSPIKDILNGEDDSIPGNPAEAASYRSSTSSVTSEEDIDFSSLMCQFVDDSTLPVEERVHNARERLFWLQNSQEQLLARKVANDARAKEMAIIVEKRCDAKTSSRFEAYISELVLVTELCQKMASRLQDADAALLQVHCGSSADDRINKLMSKREDALVRLRDAEQLKQNIEQRGVLLMPSLQSCLSRKELSTYRLFVKELSRLPADMAYTTNQQRLCESTLENLNAS